MIENTKKAQQAQQAQPAEKRQAHAPDKSCAPTSQLLQEVMATCPQANNGRAETDLRYVYRELRGQFIYFLELMLESGGSGRPIIFENGVEISITSRNSASLMVHVRADRPFLWCTGSEEVLFDDTDELLAHCLAVRNLLSSREMLVTPKSDESQKDYVSRVNLGGAFPVSGTWYKFAEEFRTDCQRSDVRQVGGLNCQIGQNRVQVISATPQNLYWVAELHFSFSLTVDYVGAFMIPAPLCDNIPGQGIAEWVNGLESWAPRSVLEGRSAMAVTYPSIEYPVVLYRSDNVWLAFSPNFLNVIPRAGADSLKYRQISGLITCPIVHTSRIATLWIDHLVSVDALDAIDEQDVLLVDAVNSVPLEHRFSNDPYYRTGDVAYVWDMAQRSMLNRLVTRVQEIRENQYRQKLAGWESIPNDDQSKLTD